MYPLILSLILGIVAPVIAMFSTIGGILVAIACLLIGFIANYLLSPRVDNAYPFAIAALLTLIHTFTVTLPRLPLLLTFLLLPPVPSLIAAVLTAVAMSIALVWIGMRLASKIRASRGRGRWR